MFTVESIVLYVNDINASKKFYEQILEGEGLVLSPTFVSFNLSNLSLELKEKGSNIPEVTVTGGGAEICIKLANIEELEQVYKNWLASGISMLQNITDVVYGLTFTASDLDEHRIRVFVEK
ncbi:VOC family protein [Spirochaeta cellobiosiphila]|uniref:VOC family protein n=1 Tax=Spirochaeta cellobiosiphila TaxID=504483 RepID=UPI0004248615|nr:VOC family protein [Spirochaeta cellobiosiphila]